jgi:hypothetical protein
MNSEFTDDIEGLIGAIILIAWIVVVMGTPLLLFFSLIKYLLGG